MSSTAALTKGPMSVVLEYYGVPPTKEVINFHIFFARRGRRPQPSVQFLFEKVVQEFEILSGLGEAYGLQETTNRWIRDFATRKFCIVYQSHAAAPERRIDFNLCANCTEAVREILRARARVPELAAEGDVSQTPEMRMHVMLQLRGLVSQISESVPEPLAVSSDKDQESVVKPSKSGEGQEEPVVKLTKEDVIYTERDEYVRRPKRRGADLALGAPALAPAEAAAPAAAQIAVEAPAPVPAEAAAPAAGTPVPQEQTLGSTVVGLVARLRARLGL